MPDKMSYASFDNVMKRTSRPIVIKSKVRAEDNTKPKGPEQGYNPNTVLLEE